jgi:hypothetical protein
MRRDTVDENPRCGGGGGGGGGGGDAQTTEAAEDTCAAKLESRAVPTAAPTSGVAKSPGRRVFCTSLPELPREIHEFTLRFLDTDTLRRIARGLIPVPERMREALARQLERVRRPGARTKICRDGFRRLYEAEITAVAEAEAAWAEARVAANYARVTATTPVAASITGTDSSVTAGSDGTNVAGVVATASRRATSPLLVAVGGIEAAEKDCDDDGDDGGGASGSQFDQQARLAAALPRVSAAAASENVDFMERLCAVDSDAVEALVDGCVSALHGFRRVAPHSKRAETAWQTAGNVLLEATSTGAEWLTGESVLVWCTLHAFSDACRVPVPADQCQLTVDCEIPVWSEMLYDSANRDAREWTTTHDASKLGNYGDCVDTPVTRALDRFMRDAYDKAAVTAEERRAVTPNFSESLTRTRFHFSASEAALTGAATRSASRRAASLAVTRVFARLVAVVAHTFGSVIMTRINSVQWVGATECADDSTKCLPRTKLLARKLKRPRTTPLADHLRRMARAFPTLPIRVLHRTPKHDRRLRPGKQGRRRRVDAAATSADVYSVFEGGDNGRGQSPEIIAENAKNERVARWRGFAVPKLVRAIGAPNMLAVRHAVQ